MKFGPLQARLVCPIGKEHPCPKHIETVASPHPIGEADQIIQAFRQRVRHQIVEVCQNVWLPVAPGCKDGLEGRLALDRNGICPNPVKSASLLCCFGVIDGIKRLFESPGFPQFWDAP